MKHPLRQGKESENALEAVDEKAANSTSQESATSRLKIEVIAGIIPMTNNGQNPEDLLSNRARKTSWRIFRETQREGIREIEGERGSGKRQGVRERRRVRKREKKKSKSKRHLKKKTERE